MKKIALLMFLSSPLAANTNLDAIQKQLIPFETLKGKFEQTKEIEAIHKPLKSEGNFTLERNKGVLWRITEPRSSLVHVSQNEITEIKDGKVAMHWSAKQQPALGLVGKIFFAVFSTNINELQRYFEFTQQKSSKSGEWNLSLHPRDSMISKAIQRIDLSGAGTVKSVVLYEANGDHTSIMFSDVLINASLSPEEEKLFEQ